MRSSRTGRQIQLGNHMCALQSEYGTTWAV